jgi:hypothetical protein
VVAGVEFHDAARPSGELALQVGGGASVFDADEVRRGCVLPGRGLHRLLEDSQALPGRLADGLPLDLRVAVLQEVSARASGRTVNVPASGSISRNGAGSSPPNEERICPTLGR